MKKLQFTTILTLTSLIISLIIPTQSKIHAETTQPEIKTLQKDYGKTPMLFEQNKGQTDRTVKFISRGKGYMLYLTEKEAVFSLKVESEQLNPEIIKSKTKSQKPTAKSDELCMTFTNANANPVISGIDEAITKTNYYIGQSKFENLSNYQKVNYKNLYHGIDAVFYGNQGNLEYDFNVLPNADANQIKLNFDGAENISIDEQGNLVIKTENSELIQQKPIAYQIINGERKEVAVSYQLIENQITFALGEYDKSQTLTIDPVLNYLTYIGGTAFDSINDIAVDSQGNTYVVGETSSLSFHGETRASNDGTGVFAQKIDPTGSQLLYTTILEGNNDDVGSGIAVDASGNVYIGGEATNGFPTTTGAFSTIKNATGTDGFIAKLNSSGNSVYVTYYGGSQEDRILDIVVDSAGKVYAVGETWSGLTFPKKNEFQGCGAGFGFNSSDGFLVVLNAAGSNTQYSTCFGGNVLEEAKAVALDSANNAYITGWTSSKNNFPVKNAVQPTSGTGSGSIEIDAFAIKFNPALSGDASVIYSTYLGGAGTDEGNGIAVNSSNQAVIVGITGSTNFPLANAFRSTNQINEGFVTVLNSSGNGLIGSSFLGGTDQDEAKDVAFGSNGLIYVTGSTLSNNFPLALPFQATRAGVRDAFVTKLRFGSGVLSSSYLGGNGNEIGNAIAVKGNFIYAAGQTASNNLATASGVISTAFNGGSNDGFVAKILDTAIDSVGVFRSGTSFQITQSTASIVSQTLTFTSLLAGQKGVSGDFDGDGITTTGSFTNGTWKLRNVNFPLINPSSVTTLNFGLAGDLPVVGDWDGNGVETVGTFRPGSNQFFLTNQINASAVNLTIQFGTAGDLPIGGDWDGDGIDTIAVFRPSTGQTFFTNENVPNPPIDFVANLGINGDLPIAGDWNGDGKDSLGLFRTSTTEFFLSDDNVNLRPVFLFGQTGDQPIAGDWDGKP